MALARCNRRVTGFLRCSESSLSSEWIGCGYDISSAKACRSYLPRESSDDSKVGEGNCCYFVLPAGGTARGGTTEDPAGLGTFLGCFGFFASRLPRCWPLGISISLVSTHDWRSRLPNGRGGSFMPLKLSARMTAMGSMAVRRYKLRCDRTVSAGSNTI